MVGSAPHGAFVVETSGRGERDGGEWWWWWCGVGRGKWGGMEKGVEVGLGGGAVGWGKVWPYAHLVPWLCDGEPDPSERMSGAKVVPWLALARRVFAMNHPRLTQHSHSSAVPGLQV